VILSEQYGRAVKCCQETRVLSWIDSVMACTKRITTSLDEKGKQQLPEMQFRPAKIDKTPVFVLGKGTNILPA
jgi:hypothetical protein